LNQKAIEDAVKKGVSVDLSFKVPMRAGLDGSVHLGQTVDFNVYSGVSTLGGGFTGHSVLTLGAGLTFRWDDVVPAVLPVERRLDREGCDAIEGRFRSCPNSRQWLSPEQRTKTPALPANAIQPTPSSGLPAQGPLPVAPAPAAKPAASPVAPAAPLPTAPAVAPPSTSSPQGAAAPPAGSPPTAAFAN
jgi:hypothetical protein